jgi:hypothetical protein
VVAAPFVAPPVLRWVAPDDVLGSAVAVAVAGASSESTDEGDD